MELTLFHYWRSGSSWRVRWGFALKGIRCKMVPVGLLDGEAEGPEHRKRNPMGYVPALEIAGLKGSQGLPDPFYVAESLAILDWAERHVPTPSFFPSDPLLRARAMQLAEWVNSGIHPLQNLNPQYLHSDDPGQRKAWAQHWIKNGLESLEAILPETAGQHCVGDAITLADICLIPQVYNAIRYEMDLAPYPLCKKLYDTGRATPECQAAEPEKFQPK